MIVEFKKPEREEYADNEDRIAQVLDYIELIRAGKVRRGSDGSTITNVQSHTPFYCYIIASLTPGLRARAKNRYNAFDTPDGQGLFLFNSNQRAYIELMDYRKVLEDSKQRNAMFFEKLGLK